MSTDVELLAQLPTSYVYIQPLKLAALVVLFTCWAAFAQWVDKDTVAVNTYRTLWNLIVLGVGAGGLLAALLVPEFLIGFPVFAVGFLAVAIVYVVHRNGLVEEKDTVLTAAHWGRVREEGLFGKKKKKVIEVKERVRLTGADKKVVPIPDEDEEREQYRLVQDVMFDTFWRRATSVEVVPSGEVAKVNYLIDGLVVEAEPLPRGEGELVIHFVKRIAGLNLDERRKPQKGEIMAAVGGGTKHRVIVRTDGSTAGEKLSVRIIREEANYKAPDLGFTAKQLEQVQAAREALCGAVVLSGPPGGGLTTTIYSMARTHDRFLQNVQTIEYEKELPIDNVTQRLFQPGEAGTFAEQLQKLVRADPDVIVLPELRERDAAVVAAKAAAAKQKVYIGLVALDVFDALRKWIAMVGDKGLVAKGLLAVSNQRLVRLLCNECKQAYKPDPQMMRKLNLPADKLLYRPPEPEYDKRGNPIICQACQGSGYVGRSGVFDWLAVDDALRKVILQADSAADIQNYVVKKGAAGLQAQALQKVLDGLTSIQEVARVVRSAGPGAGGAPRGTPGTGGPPRGSPGPRPQPKPGTKPARPAPGGAS